MQFLFTEAFQTLKLKGRAAVLLEDTVVTRVTTPKSHDYLNVYLQSDHIIPKDIIREAEREIRKQVINNPRTQVRIYESFKLSRQLDLKSVYDEYADSALIEIEENSIMFFNMMRTARVTFETDDVMSVSVADIPVYRYKEKEFSALLEDIFINRFGSRGSIEITYHEVTIQDNEDSEFLAEIRTATENAMKSEEKFLGAVPSDDKQTNSDGGEKKKPENNAKDKASGAAQGGKTGEYKGASRGGDHQYSGYRSGGFGKKTPKLMDDPNAIFGSVFPDEKTVPLSDLNEGMGTVSVKGMVFSVKATDLRDSDRSIIAFNIADFTDAISCKIYVDKSESAVMAEKLEPGTFIRLTGFVNVSNGKFDRGDLILGNVKGIVKIDDFRTPRKDNAGKKRVELRIHTKMSDMDGVSETKKIVKRAFLWGHRAVALTDNGVVQGYTDAFHLWDEDLWGGKREKRQSVRRQEILIPTDRISSRYFTDLMLIW